SVIQLFVLVLLIVVGGAGYLYQQEGNFNFVTDLIGIGSTPAPVPVPATAKAPTAPPVRRATAENKTQLETVAIPSQPVQGEIQKSPFAVEAAQIENGVLTLRQGKDPLATEVKLFLNTKPWQVPAERSFRIAPQAVAGS